MPKTKTKTKSTAVYVVKNPKAMPEGVCVFVCVNECGAEFYEGDTLKMVDHDHLNPARLIRDGFVAVTRG